MDSAPYAYRVVRQHIEKAGRGNGLSGLVCLELGPGDSVGSALIARAYGASKVLLVDSGSFSQQNMSCYVDLASYLEAQGMPALAETDFSSFSRFLDSCRAHYMTKGIASLRSLSSASVDVVWSQAVLEHIREAEFSETMREIRRVLKPGGVCSHRVDLKDHLGGALNNLRFRRSVWESDFFTKSGFYTNRIRFTAMIAAFEEAGFDVELGAIDRWAELPTPIAAMAEPYRSMNREELLVSGFDVVLVPRVADK